MQSFIRLFTCIIIFLTACNAIADDFEITQIRAASVEAVQFDISPPLSIMKPYEGDLQIPQPFELYPKMAIPIITDETAEDPVWQQDPIEISAPGLLKNFEGIGQNFVGPSGTFHVGGAPPDPNGAVGPNHYFEIVNTSIAIFNKSGTPIYGPILTRTLWSGFGGSCETSNNGDGIVQYDKLADRWIVTQFAVSTLPYLQCVAISRTGDPTGSYARYAFQYNNFPDYPKLAVWPSGYFITFNMFNGSSFAGANVCAYDRNAMLNGTAATQQCFLLPNFASLLPSDLDGKTLPPTNAPNFLLSMGFNSLFLWKFKVDWTTPANSTLTGPTILSVPAFAAACNGGSCIPQLGSTQLLDSLSDRLMYRLAYRNFGDHESMVVNHSVAAGTSVGVRWYEVRNPSTMPTIFQAGTFAPDANYRWMGSVAMDRVGNIALGYSISSSAIFPGIRYTGRLSSDPLNIMTQGEGLIINGTGSQQPNLDRWGDYTSMFVDPSDDCTFWYTNEYLATSGTFNWHTRVGAFKFPNCSAGAQDFSLSVTPTSQTIAAGQSTSYGVVISSINGFSGSVSLSINGVPSGASAFFSPNPATTNSTLIINTSASTPAGTYPLTISGTSGSLIHSVTVFLTITANQCINANPTVTISPTSNHGVAGTVLNYTVFVRNNDSAACTASTFNLTASVPSGFSQSFTRSSVTLSPGQTTSVIFSIVSPANATPGSYTFVITARNAIMTNFISSAAAVYIVDCPAAMMSISISPKDADFDAISYSLATFSFSLRKNDIAFDGHPIDITILGPVEIHETLITESNGDVSYTLFLDNSLPAGEYLIVANSEIEGIAVSDWTRFILR